MSPLCLIVPGALSCGLHAENPKQREGRGSLNLGKESKHILLIAGFAEALCLEAL